MILKRPIQWAGFSMLQLRAISIAKRAMYRLTKTGSLAMFAAFRRYPPCRLRGGISPNEST
jgi:hypothetical protein